MMWRGVTTGPPFLSGATLAVAGSTTSRKFVAYPIARRDDGTVLINWVAEAMIGGTAPPVRPDWTREGRLAEALPKFRDWTFDWLDIAGLMTRTTEILEYPMVDRDPLPFWGRGLVTLTGDAAHPMYPVGSNGGSQAIIDASVLARSLGGGRSPTGRAPWPPTRRPGCPRSARSCWPTALCPSTRCWTSVAARAPDGFDRIEDVLDAGELGTLRDAYRATSQEDVAALNSRPPILPVPPRIPPM